MKRLNVSPDLLATMTADALFAGKPQKTAADPAAPKRRAVLSLGRWFRPAPEGSVATGRSPTPRPTLDDDWVGGWYARTRLLQAATLASLPGREAPGANSTSSDVEGGESKDLVDVVTQIKDFS